MVLMPTNVFIDVTVALGLRAMDAKTALVAPTITENPANPMSSMSATFAFSGARRSTLQCQLDAVAFATCTSPKSYAGPLAQGRHACHVKELCRSEVSAPTSYSGKGGPMLPPTPSLTAKTTCPSITARPPSLSFSDSESGPVFRCTIGRSAPDGCSPCMCERATCNNGPNQSAVRSHDGAGNVSAATFYQFKYQKGLTASGSPCQLTERVSGLSLGVWKPTPVTASNPIGLVIDASALNLMMAANSTPPGCLSSGTVESQNSNVSTTRLVAVPPFGSAVLPAGTVIPPQVRLKDLSTVNHDVCKNESLPLSYTGTATN
jgi:hypothetical protein